MGKDNIYCTPCLKGMTKLDGLYNARRTKAIGVTNKPLYIIQT